MNMTYGAVLPILHLNGYKIAAPTVLARITHEELDQLLRGYGWTPYVVEGDDPEKMGEDIMDLQFDTVCIETMRFLAVDAVQKANSGHPGLPLGAAPMAQVLWTRY